MSPKPEKTSPTDHPSGDAWGDFARSFRSSGTPVATPWADVFEPLRSGGLDDLAVVAQIGQSLDGRTATASGDSKYINGPAGLAHLHRLRSLVDAVVVGIGTIIADDPQLTVRRVEGSSPVRVVIDPKGRLPSIARVLAQDGIRCLIITTEGRDHAAMGSAEIITLPAVGDRISPAAILAALAKRGLRRILIEGGTNTISAFYAAGCLDRLHIMVAPIILGDGRASFSLPSLERADHARRLPVHVHQLDDEMLFDCDLSAQRVSIGLAKIST